MSLFLCLFGIWLGWNCQKNVVKIGGIEKKDKMGGGGIVISVDFRG